MFSIIYILHGGFLYMEGKNSSIENDIDKQIVTIEGNQTIITNNLAENTNEQIKLEINKESVNTILYRQSQMFE